MSFTRLVCLSTLLTLAVSACNRCERDPKLFVPGKVRVKFMLAVTPDEAKQLIKEAGFTGTTVGNEGWMVSTVDVKPGDECAAEARLKKLTGVMEVGPVSVPVPDAGQVQAAIAKAREAMLAEPKLDGGAGAPSAGDAGAR